MTVQESTAYQVFSTLSDWTCDRKRTRDDAAEFAERLHRYGIKNIAIRSLPGIAPESTEADQDDIGDGPVCRVEFCGPEKLHPKEFSRSAANRYVQMMADAGVGCRAIEVHGSAA